MFFVFGSLFAEFYTQSIKVEKRSVFQERQYYGKVALNEDLSSVFTLRSEGFVEEIYISQTFQTIQKGTKLFSIYSPELLQAQNEYINALKYKSNIGATKEKLLLLGVSESVIETIKKTKTPIKSLPFFSQTQGVVFEKNISKGQYLKKGEMIYKIFDLSSVWFVAQIPQEELSFLSSLQTSSLKVLGINENFQAKFLQIIPTITPSSKFVEVRFLVENPTQTLFPNLFGIITLFSQPKKVIFAPKESVLLRNGKLYVFKKDEEGNFTPQEIEGVRLSSGDYEVVLGLESGDEIAQNALFILDSDAQANGDYE